MELQQNLDLIFDVDAVLRGEGAEAPVLRARSPALVNVAEQAMQEGTSLLRPKVIYQEFAVEGVRHERLLLNGGQTLESKLLVQHLAAAKTLTIVLCTIGEALETAGFENLGSQHGLRPGAGRGRLGGGGGAGQCGLPVFRKAGRRKGIAGLHPAQSGDGGLAG